jgi:hypothetical protein
MTSCYQWKRKLAAKPQTSAFLRVFTSEPTEDSIEIKIPEAGERFERTAAYHSRLTSFVALWAFRGAGCAPKPGALRTLEVLVPPSGLLRVLGVRPSPVAYAHRQRSAALRAKTKQSEQPYARSAPSAPPPLTPPAKAPGAKGGQAVVEVCH